MPEIKIIEPNDAPESVLAQHELAVDSDEVRGLGFPKSLFKFDVEIERKLLDNRETEMSVTVDLLTGTCRKNDIYPELQQRILSPTSLLNPRLEGEVAAETAYSFVRRQINQGYKSFSAPQISTVREDTVFKLFWIVPVASSSTVHVIDTITNELVAADVELDEFTKPPSKPNNEV
jgi:hypothetical protein